MASNVILRILDNLAHIKHVLNKTYREVKIEEMEHGYYFYVSWHEKVVQVVDLPIGIFLLSF